MIYTLPEGTPRAVPEDVFRRASVGDYLDALDRHAPGLDLSDDRAVAIGLVIADRGRDGELDLCRALGIAYGFDGDELDTLIAAAYTWLAPGPLPEQLRAADPDGSLGRDPLDWVLDEGEDG